MHKIFRLSYLEMQEAVSAFEDAVEDHPVFDHWYLPAASHRGYPSWLSDIDINERGDVDIGIEVSCCGSVAYDEWRIVPGYIFLNPTKENLDSLKLIYEEEDRLAEIHKEKEKQRKKEKEAEEAKERRYQEYLQLKKEFE